MHACVYVSYVRGCMYVYVCIYVCMCVYACLCAYMYVCVAVEVLGVSTRVGHRTCTRAFLHVRHTRSLRGR